MKNRPTIQTGLGCRLASGARKGRGFFISGGTDPYLFGGTYIVYVTNPNLKTRYPAKRVRV